MSNTVKYRRRGGVEKSFESVTRARNSLVLEHNGYIGTTIDPLTRHPFFKFLSADTSNGHIFPRKRSDGHDFTGSCGGRSLWWGWWTCGRSVNTGYTHPSLRRSRRCQNDKKRGLIFHNSPSVMTENFMYREWEREISSLWLWELRRL